MTVSNIHPDQRNAFFADLSEPSFVEGSLVRIEKRGKELTISGKALFKSNPSVKEAVKISEVFAGLFSESRQVLEKEDGKVFDDTSISLYNIHQNLIAQKAQFLKKAKGKQADAIRQNMDTAIDATRPSKSRSIRVKRDELDEKHLKLYALLALDASFLSKKEIDADLNIQSKRGTTNMENLEMVKSLHRNVKNHADAILVQLEKGEAKATDLSSGLEKLRLKLLSQVEKEKDPNEMATLTQQINTHFIDMQKAIGQAQNKREAGGNKGILAKMKKLAPQIGLGLATLTSFGVAIHLGGYRA